MPDKRSFRALIRAGRPLLGVFSIIPSIEVVEIVALAGFDFVILDTEHGPFGVESLGTLIVAARSRGLAAVARVRDNDPSLIGSVLDAGADGVLVPQVGSVAAARAAVSAARFAPQGTRGANPWVRAADFSGRAAWFAEANESVAVMVMIEGREGVAAAPEIIGIDGLDAVFLGPVDLSHAMGVPGETEHPLVIEEIRRVVAAAQARSVSTAIFAPTAEAARRWIERGVSLVAAGIDTGHLLDGMRQTVAKVRAD